MCTRSWAELTNGHWKRSSRAGWHHFRTLPGLLDVHNRVLELHLPAPDEGRQWPLLEQDWFLHAEPEPFHWTQLVASQEACSLCPGEVREDAKVKLSNNLGQEGGCSAPASWDICGLCIPPLPFAKLWAQLFFLLRGLCISLQLSRKSKLYICRIYAGKLLPVLYLLDPEFLFALSS